MASSHNLMLNPSFESDLARWTATGAGGNVVTPATFARQNGYAGSGSWSARLTSPAMGIGKYCQIAQDLFAILPSVAYSLRSNVKTLAVPGGCKMYMQIDWYTSAFGYISSVFGPDITIIGVSTQQITNTVAPGTAAYMSVSFIAANTTGGTGLVVDGYLDAIMVEQTATALATYADGNSAGWYWLGTPNDSQSLRGSAIAETSLSSSVVLSNLAGSRSVAETSTSVFAAPAGMLAGSRANTETSLSVLASSTAGLIGSRAAFESSTTLAAVVASLATVGGHPVAETSLSAMTSLWNLMGTASASEISLSTADTADSFLSAFASVSSTSNLAASGSMAGFRFISETSLSAAQVTNANRKASGFASVVSVSSMTSGVVRFGRANETSTSVLTLAVATQAVGYQIQLRDRMPLRLSVNVETPCGYHQRWAVDDPNGLNVPSTLTFSTVMPGGHEQGSCTLQRKSNTDYPDLVELSTIQVRGLGGFIASEGRLESLPETGGDQAQITPAWTGYQSALADDNSAREIFVDQNIANWAGPSVQRQIQWLSGTFPTMATGPAVGPDFGNNAIPALVAEMTGAWVQNQIVEGWYDAHGLPIGLLYAAWQTNGAMQLTGGNLFGAAMFLATEDTGINYDQFNPITSSTGSHTLAATTTRPWAILQFWNDTVPGGQDGTKYDVYWTHLGVYGNHGLRLYATTDPSNPTLGVKASDVAGYILDKWTQIAYTTGTNGSIQASSFVIPQLVFLDPTLPSEMLKQITAYELLDWAVWEGPMFYMNARNARGRKWRSRIGPAQLQSTGPQISRLWNGVIVQFTDVTGIVRTYGPPGSNSNQMDATLVDTDGDNPINEVGINRWALVTMGVSTFAAALQVGQLFLKEQKLLSSAGQATLTGHVQDNNGIFWPAWMVRAGDQISFVDSDDSSYRRIVHTSYDDGSRANSIQLDQPPDSLAALLQRLNIVLQPYGLG